VTVYFGNSQKTQWRVGGGSFQSAPDGRLHFGLGSEPEIKRVEVVWPSGSVDRLENLKPDRQIEIKEGLGQK